MGSLHQDGVTCRTKMWKRKEIAKGGIGTEGSPVAVSCERGSYRGDSFATLEKRGSRKRPSFNLCAQNPQDPGVPMNSDARPVLEVWAMGRENEIVFYNHETGKPFVDLDAGLALACRKAGIEGVTWHKLRHTFASRLVNRGGDIVTVQQLLGHSTVVTTMRYTHTNLDSKRHAVAKLIGFGDNLVTPCTKMQHQGPNMSPKIPLKAVARYTQRRRSG